MASKSVFNYLVNKSHDVDLRLFQALMEVGPFEISLRNNSCLGEILCRSVAGQQLSVKAARTIWGRLVESAGDEPLLEHFRRSKPEKLRTCGLSHVKGRAMRAIAEAYKNGVLDENTLAKLTVEERSARFMAIYGVGQWTADMMNLFFFGEPDIWPATDVAAYKTLERLTEKPSQEIAASFAPYRSYLAMAMWRVADSEVFGR